MKVRKRIRRNVRGTRSSTLQRGLEATDRVHFDGVFRTEIKPHRATGELLVERTQPDRGIILERNAALRREPEALRPLSFGALAATIPLEDLEQLARINPELQSTDPATRRAAWLRFLQSPESLPYRVRERV